MAICEFAKKELVHYAASLPKRDHQKTLIFHTNGGGTDKGGTLFGWFDRAGNDICSHFQIAKDGTLFQYVDTDHEAYAQFSGNAYGVSVETEDDGHPDTPWTDAQIKTAIKLAKWLGCPAKVSADGTGGGVGWHSLYYDWNKDAHNCPGSVRVAQIHTQILPGISKAKPQPGPAPHPHSANAPAWYNRQLMYTQPMMHGADVKDVQKLVGLKGKNVDGKYGAETEREVSAWQQKNDLTHDGIFGPASAHKAYELQHAK